jgi:uncharacterized protein YicC (UPF0701 family)
VDSADGERWMTYAEIADMRGCSRAAAERWTQRQKLRRQPGNDGKTLVLVAPNVVEQAHPRRVPRADPADITPALAAFEQALNTIREAHASEVSALREAHAGETSTLREQLEQARAQAIAALERAEARADAADAAALAAQDAAEAIRREREVEWARGRWARLRAAWRGK